MKSKTKNKTKNKTKSKTKNKRVNIVKIKSDPKIKAKSKRI